jgi:16S rRNA C967 or C1407 C5-methylase (RsmB/RsmF family)
MRQLPTAYLERMKTQLGEDGVAVYLHAMEEQPRRALRVNTLKTDVDTFYQTADFSLAPTTVLPESFFF